MVLTGFRIQAVCPPRDVHTWMTVDRGGLAWPPRLDCDGGSVLVVELVRPEDDAAVLLHHRGPPGSGEPEELRRKAFSGVCAVTFEHHGNALPVTGMTGDFVRCNPGTPFSTDRLLVRREEQVIADKPWMFTQLAENLLQVVVRLRDLLKPSLGEYLGVVPEPAGL